MTWMFFSTRRGNLNCHHDIGRTSRMLWGMEGEAPSIPFFWVFHICIYTYRYICKQQYAGTKSFVVTPLHPYCECLTSFIEEYVYVWYSLMLFVWLGIYIHCKGSLCNGSLLRDASWLIFGDCLKRWTCGPAVPAGSSLLVATPWWSKAMGCAWKTWHNPLFTRGREVRKNELRLKGDPAPKGGVRDESQLGRELGIKTQRCWKCGRCQICCRWRHADSAPGENWAMAKLLVN